MPWIALVPLISGVCSVLGTFEMTAKPTKPASTRIVRLVSSISGRPASVLARGGVDDLPVAHDAGPRDDLIVPVERQLAVLVEQQLEQRRARCARRAAEACSGISAGRFSGETIVTSCSTVTSPGRRQLAVAAGLAGEVDDHAARLHPLDRLGGDELRRRAPGHERRRDDDVEALDRVGQRLLLGAPSPHR